MTIPAAPAAPDAGELERLRAENRQLRELNRDAFGYIRRKVDELLLVVGTRTLAPEELRDHELIELDPIGIVATTFGHILDNLRATNRQLREAHGEIQAIFDTVGSALLVVDPQRRIISFNRQAGRTLVEPDGEVLGRCCMDILCAADPEPEECAFLQVMNTGTEALVCGKPLRGRVYDVIAGPIYADDGTISQVVMAYHDVTEARRVELMKSEFVSTAAHELRTPLATIIGYADLMLGNPELARERLHEYLTLIIGRAEHLSHIVSDLLDVSRIEAGEGLRLVFEPCRLDLICREAAWAHEDVRRSHPIVLALPEEEAVIEGDRFALMQVLENLLSNAIKYSPRGGEIVLRVVPAADGVQLTVADRGIGMTAEQVEHIFDKFYRVNSSNAAIPGTGLGMTIVKYLIEAHHGRIAVESESGIGTTVRIELPRRQPAA